MKTKTAPSKIKSAFPMVAEAVTRVARTHKPPEMDVDKWQRLLRKQFAEKQEFKLVNQGDHAVFSDFSLTNPATGKTYRIAIRGDKPGIISVPVLISVATPWVPASISNLPWPA